jgi:hypothetical protein
MHTGICICIFGSKPIGGTNFGCHNLASNQVLAKKQSPWFWHAQVFACPSFGRARLVLNQLSSNLSFEFEFVRSGH